MGGGGEESLEGGAEGKQEILAVEIHTGEWLVLEHCTAEA